MPQGEEGHVAGAASSAGNAHQHTEPPREPVYVDGESSLHLLADLQALVLSLEHGNELSDDSTHDGEPIAAGKIAPEGSSEARAAGAASPAGLKRSLSWGNQEQVSALVSEYGSLLNRLESCDAQDLRSTLDEMSEANELSAILSDGLGQSNKDIVTEEIASLVAELRSIQKLEADKTLRDESETNSVAADLLLEQGDDIKVAQDTMSTYEAFLVANKEKRAKDKELWGPLANLLLSPGGSPYPVSSPNTSPRRESSSPKAPPASPKDFQSFLRHHKRGKRIFKAMLKSPDLMRECIAESPEEYRTQSAEFVETVRSTLPRTLSETTLQSLDDVGSDRSSILCHGIDANDDAESLDALPGDSILFAHPPRHHDARIPLDQPIECTESEEPIEGTKCDEKAQQRIHVLMEETAAVLTRLNSVDASEVPNLLADMSHQNDLAAILASNLKTSDSVEASENEIESTKELGSQTNFGSQSGVLLSEQKRKIYRTISFDTEEQLSNLMSECGSLLTRLASSDARDLSNLLSDMSGSSALAAILLDGLISDAPITSTDDHVRLSDTVERAEVGTAQERRETEAEVGTEQELLNVLLEQTGSLIARLNSTDTGGVEGLLSDMSERNCVASALLSQSEQPLPSHAEINALINDAGSLMTRMKSEGNTPGHLHQMKEDNALAAIITQELMSASVAAKDVPIPDVASANMESLRSETSQAANEVSTTTLQPTLSIDTQEHLDLLVEEMGALMGRLGSSNASNIENALQEMSSRNAVAAILASRIRQDTVASQTSPSELASASSEQVLIEPLEGGRNRSLKRSLSLNTQNELDDLVKESGTLLDRLASTQAEAAADLLFELKDESILAGILCEAMAEKPTKTNSLTKMFKQLKADGAVVETRLGKSGSFRVHGKDNDSATLSEQSLAAALEDSGMESVTQTSSWEDHVVMQTLRRNMAVFRQEAAKTRQDLAAVWTETSSRSMEAVEPREATATRRWIGVLDDKSFDSSPSSQGDVSVHLPGVESSPTNPDPIGTTGRQDDVAAEVDPNVGATKANVHNERIVENNDAPKSTGSSCSFHAATSDDPQCIVDNSTEDGNDVVEDEVHFSDEFESEDDVSDDGEDDFAQGLCMRKRTILVKGLKVLHMATLKKQSYFFLAWQLQRPAQREELSRDIRDWSGDEDGPNAKGHEDDPKDKGHGTTSACDRNAATGKQDGAAAAVVKGGNVISKATLKGGGAQDEMANLLVFLVQNKQNRQSLSRKKINDHNQSPHAVCSSDGSAAIVPDERHIHQLTHFLQAHKEKRQSLRRQGSKGCCDAIPDVRGQCDGFQEPSIVQVQKLPQSLNLIWPDLDLDSYSTGTSAVNPVDPHRSQTKAS